MFLHIVNKYIIYKKYIIILKINKPFFTYYRIQYIHPIVII